MRRWPPNSQGRLSRRGTYSPVAEYLRVARVEDVPPGTVKTFYVGEQHLAVANVDGEFYAIQDVCTHDGGPLGEGEVLDHEVECPRHGAHFDLRTGRATAFPAVMGIRTYPVRVEDSEIRVAL